MRRWRVILNQSEVNSIYIRVIWKFFKRDFAEFSVFTAVHDKLQDTRMHAIRTYQNSNVFWSQQKLLIQPCMYINQTRYSKVLRSNNYKWTFLRSTRIVYRDIYLLFLFRWWCWAGKGRINNAYDCLLARSVHLRARNYLEIASEGTLLNTFPKNSPICPEIKISLAKPMVTYGLRSKEIVCYFRHMCHQVIFSVYLTGKDIH